MGTWAAKEIAYCANVHPGTTACDIEANLRSVTAAVRLAAGLDHMYAGLWICESALGEYQDPKAVARLRQVLTDEQLSVVTFNGFPQQDFHQAVVKSRVYSPNWSQPRRLDYTIGLARLLASCLPDDVDEGSISTLPLGYRQDWDTETQQKALANLFAYAQAADAIFQQTGKRIRLCLEMEPGCVLENTAQALAFFTQTLPDFALSLTQQCHDTQGSEGRPAQDASSIQHTTLLQDYLGLCFDICHQAVMQEDIGKIMSDIRDAGIRIGKIQVSSALKVMSASDAATRKALQQFAEPKYLHQTTVRCADGEVLFFNDLDEALTNSRALQSEQWWVHYHLPIQSENVALSGHIVPGLQTTRDSIETCLDCLAALPNKPHIEIETYTWHVLPKPHADTEQGQAWLVEGLSQERQWLLEAMRQRKLVG